MRFFLLLNLLIFHFGVILCQQVYPVKINKKWGLMNGDGKIVSNPIYNAIGEFKAFGYAVMQRENGVGMLNAAGKEVVPPIYDDLKALDSTLISVMKDQRWKVIDLQGKVMLQPGYEKVNVLKNKFIAFTKNMKWGVVNRQGKIIAPPVFQSVEIFNDHYIRTQKEDKYGLLSLDGKVIIENVATEIVVEDSIYFFYKKNEKWGINTQDGERLLPSGFQTYQNFAEGFIQLKSNHLNYLFSKYLNKIISEGEYDAFLDFSSDYVITRKNTMLGLLDECGTANLPPMYFEIQAYSDGLFRVNKKGKWGVVDDQNNTIIPFDYDYIAPMKDKYCVVIQEKKLGVANHHGELVVPTQFDRIELEKSSTRAFKGDALEVFNFNAISQLSNVSHFDNFFTIKIGKKRVPTKIGDNTKNQYILKNFEWFYSPLSDKWGLRRLDNGDIQIEPTFDEVQVYPDLNLTLVGMHQYNNYDFDRTTYRFETTYGLVNNEVGLLVKDMDLLDLRLADFEAGLPVARCIFNNGKHGLVNRIGQVVARNYTYIGAFHEGMARASQSGDLSGSLEAIGHSLGDLKTYLKNLLSPVTCVDFTQFDKEFERDAVVICDRCSWGYIDTTAQMVVPGQYSFARDIISEVGIVECNGKYGLISKNSEELIPCDYDQVSFMENTGNKIIRLYKKDEKYGLIDTLGQLCVNLKYDEIGSFNEGRLAVKFNGLWGFVNKDGQEVIPCRFNRVGNFSDGYASAKVNNDWGFIDKMGDVLIDFQYSQVGNFVNGMTYVKNESAPFGFINKNGEWVIDPQFIGTYDFNEFGIARFEELIGDHYKTGLIDQSGQVIVKPKYISIGRFHKNGLAVAGYGKVPTKFGLINIKGEMITKEGYREIGNFYEGLAMVRTRNGWGYIDEKGKTIIEAQFSKVGDFSEGKAYAKDPKSGRFGYINKKGQWVIEPQFSRCLDFRDGKAVVFQGNKKAGLIDDKGNFSIEPSIDQMLIFSEGRGLVMDYKDGFYYITDQANVYDGFYENASEFQNGIAVVKSEGRWGIINQKGIEIIPPKYDKIEEFVNGYARVCISGFSGLANLKGEFIVQPDYEYISYAGDGLFRVEKDDKIGYYNMEGKSVWGLRK